VIEQVQMLAIDCVLLSPYTTLKSLLYNMYVV